MASGQYPRSIGPYGLCEVDDPTGIPIVDPGLGMERLPLSRPAWLPASVWPFNTFGLRIDGAELVVTDAGQGPTLLLVHTGSWSFTWRDLMLRLVRDFRCVCFDVPGNGRSASLEASETTLEGVPRAPPSRL